MSGSVCIAQQLRFIACRLQESASPELDARLLLRHVLGCNAAALILREQQSLTIDQLQQLESLVLRRSRGEPMAYIIGQQDFWDMSLAMCEGVLVPRPDTEILVGTALGLNHNDRPWKVAELGTGSGAIALALARERPQWQLLATDCSPLALQLAQQNARQLKLKNICFCRSDWCQALRPSSLDVLLSNPPYITANDPHLDGDGVRFEPRKALVSGIDGLDAIRRITTTATTCLRSGGWLLLEHGADQATAVRDCLAASSFTNIRTVTDLANNPRVTLGQLFWVFWGCFGGRTYASL